MADTNYSINVSTQQAQQNLTRLQSSLQKTNETFAKLGTALAGLVSVSAINSLVNYAAAIDDVAVANDLAISTVIGFTRAVQEAGGSLQGAQQGLNRFTTNISAAAEGSAALQNTFAELGIGLEDLARLSNQDLLKRTVEGLGRIEDVGKRARVSTELFGRALRGVDVVGVANAFGSYTASATASEASIRNAAKAQENFERVIGDLKIGLLDALEPLSRFAAEFNTASSGVASAIRSLVEFIKVAGTIFAVIAGVKLLAAGFGLIAGAMTVAATVGANLFRILRVLFKGGETRSNLAKNLDELGTVGEKARVVLNAMGAQVDWLKKNFPVLASVVGGAAAALKEFFSANNNAGTDEAIRLIEEEKAALIARRAELEKDAEVVRKVTEANQEKISAIRQGTEEYARQVQQVGIQIARETELIGKSKEYADLIRAQAEASTRAAAEIEKLRKAKELLKQEDQEGNVGAEYDRQIVAVRRLADEEQLRLTALIEGLNAAERANQVRLNDLAEEFRVNQELADLQDQINQSVLGDRERAFNNIEIAARKAGDAAVRAEEARLNRPLSADEAAKYYEISARGTDRLKAKQAELFEMSRKFSTGWKRAFNEYADNATNAARRAEDIFRKATQGMEDAIVNFAKTGKFEFRDFVNMMLEEMLRANVQASIAGIMGSMGRPGAGAGAGGGSGGGFLGSIGSIIGGLFGGGGGGRQQQQQPSTNSGGSLLGSIGSFINKNIFGGFFANGGFLPAGKVGIVGERGPELISGPANITPMSGTTVNYYIQAVDAPSFQALVARDPGFIHAVAQQGARSMPMGRR
jgi:lambda family phage tail tape measure protein